MAHQLDGFSKLSRPERLTALQKLGLLDESEVSTLMKQESLSTDLAEHFIENVIGYFQIPLGVAPHFRIDGKDYVIPMAVEETSIIAAASFTAKWIKNSGEITTEQLGNLVIGQIQMSKVPDPDRVERLIGANKTALTDLGNSFVQSLVARGGGVKDITIRRLTRPDGETMIVLHVLMDTRDAMGANLINQVCEGLKPTIAKLTCQTVNICILSNLTDTRLTRARVRVRNVDPKLGEGISEASLFAQMDPYRAATNNKGVLNGIDAVLVATGNDWRAVEAGVHAYAARDERYGSITRWLMDGADLVGELVAPISVGTVGGVTRLHPTARLCLKLLGVQSAEELSRVCAAVGLVQNLGALKALSTVGIVEGHMKLHAANLALATGAESLELPVVRKKIEEKLKRDKRITLSHAIEILEVVRKEMGHV